MQKLIVGLAVLLLVLAPACQMNERISGTAMGAVGGGVIGGIAAGWGGAVVGAAGGALIGYLVGDYNSDQRERGRDGVFGSRSDTDPAVHQTRVNTPAAEAYERGRQARTSVEAKRWFEKSVELDPTRAEPYNALGLNALAAGDVLSADRLIRKAIQVNPRYLPARYNLERLHREHAVSHGLQPIR